MKQLTITFIWFIISIILLVLTTLDLIVNRGGDWVPALLAFQLAIAVFMVYKYERRLEE